MASVTVDRERLGDSSPWPSLCARCAATPVTLVPVPERFQITADGLVVPLCPTHSSHWTQWRFRQRIGLPGMIGVLLVAFTLSWFVLPEFDAQMAQSGLVRFLTSIWWGVVTGGLISIPLILWVGMPIRVTEQAERTLVLSGVCRRFAQACGIVAGRPPLPEVPADTTRFEVEPYQSRPMCSPSAAILLLLGSCSLGAVMGLGFGVIGPQIGVELAHWGEHSWGYYGLALAAIGTYTTLLLCGWIPILSRLGFLLLLASLACWAVALLALGLVFSYQGLFGTVLTGPAILILCWLFILRRIRLDRVRDPRIAVLASLAGPLTLAGVTYLLAGLTPGPHQSVYLGSIILAVATAIYAADRAAHPYCQTCHEWLDEHRLGALARSRAEVEPLLSQGNLLPLANEPVRSKADTGEVELRYFACPQCADESPLVLELREMRRVKNSQTLARVGCWVYPGLARPVLQNLFPPPPTLS